ncbi:hypothetical protein FKM82_012338 [Ascaphus truei]
MLKICFLIFVQRASISANSHIIQYNCSLLNCICHLNIIVAYHTHILYLRPHQILYKRLCSLSLTYSTTIEYNVCCKATSECL